MRENDLANCAECGLEALADDLCCFGEGLYFCLECEERLAREDEEAWRQEEESLPDLGPCCICRTGDSVRNVLMLNARSPIPGHPQPCLQCGLSPNGASVVLCDVCLQAYQDGTSLVDACRGYPGVDGRVPFSELWGDHRHNMARHPEAQPGDDGG